MSPGAGFREWLNKARFSRNVCMLIPMEACMGHPIVVERGAEFILPFFRATSVGATDKLGPPFAYLRLRYPSAEILTYNHLRTLPAWKSLDWDVLADTGGRDTAAKLESYYESICRRDGPRQSAERQDGLLLDCLGPRSAGNGGPPPLVAWYRMLIAEAEKYR